LDNILFCSSVLLFATAAILAYWQIVRTQIDKADQSEQDLKGASVEPAQTFADLAA
jgi:hypothetical protein